MVRLQGLTAAALGAMLSVHGSGDQHLEGRGADSLVPQGPEPVMDGVGVNERSNAQMGARSVGPHPPASSTELTEAHCSIICALCRNQHSLYSTSKSFF